MVINVREFMTLTNTNDEFCGISLAKYVALIKGLKGMCKHYFLSFCNKAQLKLLYPLYVPDRPTLYTNGCFVILHYEKYKNIEHNEYKK